MVAFFHLNSAARRQKISPPRLPLLPPARRTPSNASTSPTRVRKIKVEGRARLLFVLDEVEGRARLLLVLGKVKGRARLLIVLEVEGRARHLLVIDEVEGRMRHLLVLDEIEGGARFLLVLDEAEGRARFLILLEVEGRMSPPRNRRGGGASASPARA